MLRILLLSLVFTAGMFTDVSAAVVAPPPVKTEAKAPTRAELEEKLGRKLTFRERLAFKVLARKQKKQARKARAAAGDGEPGNGWAIAGFVLGVLSLVGLSIIAGIPAIVLSAIGLNKAKREGRPHKGLAIAGLVCGLLSVVILLLVVALVFAFATA